jgi:hypothetical protein
MTTEDAVTPDEWTSVLQGPTGAGMLVVMATRGGIFRETVALSKAYAEARTQHGKSELLDEVRKFQDRVADYKVDDVAGE